MWLPSSIQYTNYAWVGMPFRVHRTSTLFSTKSSGQLYSSKTSELADCQIYLELHEAHVPMHANINVTNVHVD